jgi:predicted amidohydrolase
MNYGYVEDMMNDDPEVQAIREELGLDKSSNVNEESIRRTSKRYNTHLLINEEGQIISKYRKIHLFDVDLTTKGGVQYSEGGVI